MTGPAAPPAYPTHVTGFSPRFLGNAPRVKAYASGSGGGGGGAVALAVTADTPPSTSTGAMVGGSGCLADGSSATYIQYRHSGGFIDTPDIILTGTWSRPGGSTTPAALMTITADVTGADTGGPPHGLVGVQVVYGYDTTTGAFVDVLPDSVGGFPYAYMPTWPTSGTAHVIGPFVDGDTNSTWLIDPTTAALIDANGGNVALRMQPVGTPTVDLRIYEVTASIDWGSGGAGPTIPTGVDTDISWNSDSINFDPSSISGAPFGTSVTKLTPPTPGRYHVTSHVLLEANASGKRVMDVKKWAAGGGSSVTLVRDVDHKPSVADSASLQAVAEENFAAGEYMTVTLHQDSGVALGLTYADATMHWVADD